MAYNNTLPRAEYVASSSQIVFPFLFKIFSETDIKVYKTLAGAVADDANDILTLTADYTVTINGDTGGEVTLNSGAAINDKITLVRSLDINRTIEYQQNGDLLASVLNTDQDYQTYLMADQNARWERSLVLPESYDGDVFTLPAPDAHKMFRWDLTGQRIENIDPSSILDTTNGIIVETVEDLATIDTSLHKTAIVKDLNRGGTFIWSANGTVNSGTVFAGATGYWVRRYDGTVNVKWFGAIGDGVTDNTVLFDSIEATITGECIDLFGMTLVVSYIPNSNNYINGSFKIANEVYHLNRNPREHPLANPTIHAKTILAGEGKYRGLSTAAFNRAGSSRVVVVYREALGHAPENNVPIYCGITDDMGDRFGLSTTDGVTSKIIVQQSNADIRNWASGVMGNNRFGILASRYDVDSSAYLSPLFLYSDDDGSTWNTSNVPFTSTTWDSHSRIYPFPSIVGGHDTLGWIAYAYTTSHGICAMKTIDNGASWTEVLNCVLPTSMDPLSEATSLSEMSVARIGTENKWVMVIRTNQEAAVSTSTNMTTWTSAKLIQSTTIAKLMANPPELTYEDGKLWLWSFSRRGGKEIYPEYANALMVSEGVPSDVFSSSGVSGWKQWNVVSNLPFWPSGYMNMFKVRNRQFALCTTGEDTAGSSTSRQCVMTLLGPDPTVATGANSLMHLIPKPNLYTGGDFRYFPITTAILSGASRVHFAPQMSFARSGGAAGATLTRLGGNASQFKIRVQRDDGDVSTASPNISLALLTEDSYALRNRFVTISFSAIAGSGFSALNSFLGVRMRQTTSTAEGVVTSTSGTLPVGDTVVQSSNTGIKLTQYWQRYELVVGPFSANMNQAQLQILWTPTGTATNDFFEFENLKIEEGKVQTPFYKYPIADIKTWADRFIRVFNMPTINGRQFRNIEPKMHRDPIVTLSRGTLIASTADYITVDDTASSIAAVTLIAPM